MPDSPENPRPADPRPTISCCPNGPYVVEGLPALTGADGEQIPLYDGATLCRCGHSREKPFCDSSHLDIGFDDSASSARKSRPIHEYAGSEVTIVDDRRICSHDESCVKELPAVFDRSKKPWIDPDGAGKDDIIRVIRMCPSGALSYKIGALHFDSIDREARITIVENGPIRIEGAIILDGPPEIRPTSPEHYALCRCGRSANKPFCDGSHFSSPDS